MLQYHRPSESDCEHKQPDHPWLHSQTAVTLSQSLSTCLGSLFFEPLASRDVQQQVHGGATDAAGGGAVAAKGKGRGSGTHARPDSELGSSSSGSGPDDDVVAKPSAATGAGGGGKVLPDIRALPPAYKVSNIAGQPRYWVKYRRLAAVWMAEIHCLVCYVCCLMVPFHCKKRVLYCALVML